MATFLFDKVIFGPVQSRRLGTSLGINLLPLDGKICSFNCIYCECGWNPDVRMGKSSLPDRKDVADKLEEKLREMLALGQLPDVITFAGNGEPTLHPQFPEIVEDTIRIRDQFAAGCKISVLSNATTASNKNVFDALLKIDNNIQKLDSAVPETLRTLNCPTGKFSVKKLIENLSSFSGRLIVQTLFLRGKCNDKYIDNTTEEELFAWINALKLIRPRKVMVYSLSRETPAKDLEKVPVEELQKIAERVRDIGIEVQVS